MALLLALTVFAGSSVAAGPQARSAAVSVTLNLQGGYANQTRSACGSAHHYVLYRRNRRIDFKGTVTPAPSGAARMVKLKIKKCVRGRFVRVKELHLRVNSRGDYQGSFRIRRRGSYFARTYFYGVQPAARSDKRHFRIR